MGTAYGLSVFVEFSRSRLALIHAATSSIQVEAGQLTLIFDLLSSAGHKRRQPAEDRVDEAKIQL